MADGPVGPGSFTLSWVQLLSAVLALPGTAFVGGMLWRAWVWWWDRFDRHKDSDRRDSASLEEQLRAARVANEQRVDEKTDRLLDAKDKQIVEIKEERADVEIELSRWSAIARHWYWSYRDLVPVFRQAITIASSASRRLLAAGLIREDELPRFDVTLPERVPDIEDPLQSRNSNRSAAVGDPHDN